MNNIYELAKGLCDLVERSRRDINVDDVMIECVMQKIKDRHDQGIDCDMFLMKPQSVAVSHYMQLLLERLRNIVNKQLKTTKKFDARLQSTVFYLKILTI